MTPGNVPLAELRRLVAVWAMLSNMPSQALLDQLFSMFGLRNEANNQQSLNAAALHVLHQVTGVKPAQTPSGLQLQCPREHKMAALAALTPLGARVQDLRLHEPSLEDMFFGISA